MLFATLALSFFAALIEYRTAGVTIVFFSYLLINPFFVCVPRFCFLLFPRLRTQVTKEWLRILEPFGFLIILLNAPGSLFLHALGMQYDRFLHLAMGTVLFPIGILLAIPFRNRLSDGWVLFILVTELFLWEGYQFIADHLFGTHLFFDNAQTIARDFTEDILFGLLGIILGRLLFAKRLHVWRNRMAP